MWIVKCVDFIHTMPPQVIFVGPFPWQDDADDFIRSNTRYWDELTAIPLVKPPEKLSIHPNQAEISDYTDPSVAN